jgi:hypothetical protein
MSPEQPQEILTLRTQGLTPKEIARKLGLRPAEVTAIIRADGEQTTQDRLARGELPPIYECLMTGEFPQERFLAEGEHLPAKLKEERRASSGLAIVVVTRKERPGKLLLYSYLVDYYCLGVKDAMGPKYISEKEYPRISSKLYDAFIEDPQIISLEKAQAIVLSSLAYANSIGLSPHADFTEAALDHLGDWDQQLTIRCGDADGKPSFVAGPYDSSGKIMEILDRTVGRDNYHYLAPLDSF